MIEIFVVQYFTYRIINLTLSMSKYQSISTRQKSKITSELLKKIVVNSKSKKMQTFHLKSSLVKPPAVEEATSRWQEMVIFKKSQFLYDVPNHESLIQLVQIDTFASHEKWAMVRVVAVVPTPHSHLNPFTSPHPSIVSHPLQQQ